MVSRNDSAAADLNGWNTWFSFMTTSAMLSSDLFASAAVIRDSEASEAVAPAGQRVGMRHCETPAPALLPVVSEFVVEKEEYDSGDEKENGLDGDVVPMLPMCPVPPPLNASLPMEEGD